MASSAGSSPSSPGDSTSLAEPVVGDAEGERFRLFEAACFLLSNVSRSWPVVLVLEDLHWADKPTALLLAHVVRSIETERVLVIGTYRDTEPGEPLRLRARRPAPRAGGRAAAVGQPAPRRGRHA